MLENIDVTILRFCCTAYSHIASLYQPTELRCADINAQYIESSEANSRVYIFPVDFIVLHFYIHATYGPRIGIVSYRKRLYTRKIHKNNAQSNIYTKYYVYGA